MKDKKMKKRKTEKKKIKKNKKSKERTIRRKKNFTFVPATFRKVSEFSETLELDFTIERQTVLVCKF